MAESQDNEASTKPVAAVTSRGSPRGRLGRLVPGVLVTVAMLALAVVLARLPSQAAVASPGSSPSEAVADSPLLSFASTPAPGSMNPGPLSTPRITEPLVELAVVDRPGVPAELYDRYWVTEVAAPWPGMDGGSAYEAGQVGTTARILLPPDELALGADDGRVASVLLDPVSGGVAVGPNGATFLVRDIRTGALLRTVGSRDRPLTSPNRAALFNSLLIWTAENPRPSTDGGLVALDLADPESVPTRVLASGGDLSGFGEGASRGPLHISPSGQTLVSVVGGSEGSRTDVIKVSNWTVRASLEGTAFSTGDQSAIFRRAEALELVELESGRRIATLATDLVFTTTIVDQRAFVAFAQGHQYVIGDIDLETGATRDVLVQSADPLYLSGVLSSHMSMVLLPDYDIGSSFEMDRGTGPMGLTGRSWATLLDPETGALRESAFTVGAP